MKTEGKYPLPPQHETAMRHVRRQESEEKAGKIEAVLTHIDNQIFSNLTPRTYPEHPGTIFPFTKVVISSHPESQEIPRKIIEVSVQGFATPPDGHPVSPEKFYDRVFTHLRKAVKTNTPTEITIAKLGQPTGMGGRVSKEFYKAKKEGFSVEGKLFASLAHELLPEDEAERKNTQVIFDGTSMGALEALEAAMRFDEPGIEKKAHLIKPPRIPGLSKKFQPSSLQILAGYTLEGLVKKRMKSLKEEVITPQYKDDLRNFFREKDLDPQDSIMQRLRKEKVVYRNVLNIMKNKIHKNEDYNFPVNVHIGAIDPINFSLASLENGIRKEEITQGNIKVEFSMTTHTTNYYRVEKWAEAIPDSPVKQVNLTVPETNKSLIPVLK